MDKTLIRGNIIPPDAEVLSTSEFMKTAMIQISKTALSINELDNDDFLLEEMADVLELMGEYLKCKNINPQLLFEKINEVRNTKGTFEKKVAV